jgi:hypothetical protein
MLYLIICNSGKQTNVLEKWLSHQIYTIGDGAVFLLSYGVSQEDNALRIKGNLSGDEIFMAEGSTSRRSIFQDQNAAPNSKCIPSAA